MKNKRTTIIPGQHKSKRLPYYIGSFPICMVLGWGIGIYLEVHGMPASSLDEVLHAIQSRLFVPYALIGLAAGFVGWLMFCMVLSSQTKHLESGREYGEARFAAPKELLPHIAGDAESDKILGQNLHMSIDDKKTGLNASCLLIGGSGSGKSFRYVAPNILQANSSFVLTDPKGTLLTDYGNYLLMKGYQVKVINISNPYASDSFNPFSYIRSNTDIVRLVNDYIRATTPKNSNESDPFWSKAESKLCISLIQLMLVAYPDDCTMRKFLELLNMVKAPSKNAPPSELEQIFASYKEEERVLCMDETSGQPVIISGQRAYENYKGIMDSAEDTCRSVIISALARYDTINNSPKLVEMLSGHDSVDFRAIGMGYEGRKQKTALFIITSDIDKTFGGIALWVQASLFNELYAAADSQESGRLRIPVQIYMDEFANQSQGENVLQLFSTARSRSISITAIIQSYGQLKGMFKDESENIQGTSDCLIYMGSSEPSVHKSISEQLGKYTLNKQSSSTPTGTSGSGSRNTDALGKELMSQDRVRMLPGDKEIILVRGYDPVLDDKYRTEKSRRFQEAMSYGKYEHAMHHNTEFAMDCMGALNDSEIAYFMEKGVQPIVFTAEEFASLPEDAFASLPDGDTDIMEHLLRLKESIAMSHSGEASPIPFSTLKEVLLASDYTEEQVAQARLGLEQGLSEEQVLEYFQPGYSAERMAVLRTMLAI